MPVCANCSATFTDPDGLPWCSPKCRSEIAEKLARYQAKKRIRIIEGPEPGRQGSKPSSREVRAMKRKEDIREVGPEVDVDQETSDYYRRSLNI